MTFTANGATTARRLGRRPHGHSGRPATSVASVQISIQKDGGASACWDGTDAAGHFTSACPNYVNVAGTTSWTKTLSAGSLVDGSSYVMTVKTTDNATNANTNSAATSSFVYDNTPPTAAVTFPANGTHYNSAGWVSTLSGTSADASSTVQTVKVSIQDTTAGGSSCWDGVNGAGHFTSACPNYITATGTTAWTLATLGSGALVDGHAYTATVQTIDNATNANTNNSAATSSFTYDNTAPTAAVSFPANGTHYNAAGWVSTLSGTSADASSTVASVQISIQKDGGASACWDGTDAAGHFTSACPNYVSVTGTTSWTKTLSAGSLVNGSSYVITVKTTDNATNANTNNTAATSSFVYDTSAPTAAVTFPASGTHYNSGGWVSTLSGTAADASLHSADSQGLDPGHHRRRLQLLGRHQRSRPLRRCLPQLHHRHRHHRLDTRHPRQRRPRRRPRLHRHRPDDRQRHQPTTPTTAPPPAASPTTPPPRPPRSPSRRTPRTTTRAGWSGTVSGTATDSGSGGNGIASTQISIQKDGGASACWDGTNGAGHFGAACPNWVTVTNGTATNSGTASWTSTLGTAALVDGSSYQTTLRTTDGTTSGNQNASAATGTFSYDTTAPVLTTAVDERRGYDADAELQRGARHRLDPGGGRLHARVPARERWRVDLAVDHRRLGLRLGGHALARDPAERQRGGAHLVHRGHEPDP